MILVGEMRDEETVRTALSAAETGHLVLSTIHTVDASESVNRIIDFFPQTEQRQARAMLAGTLKAVVSQRLVPTAGPPGPDRELRDPAHDRPGARHDRQPGGDRAAARGDRRGRLLRHADLRPGPARARAGRAGRDGRGAQGRDAPARLQAAGQLGRPAPHVGRVRLPRGGRSRRSAARRDHPQPDLARGRRSAPRRSRSTTRGSRCRRCAAMPSGRCRSRRRRRPAGSALRGSAAAAGRRPPPLRPSTSSSRTSSSSAGEAVALHDQRARSGAHVPPGSAPRTVSERLPPPRRRSATRTGTVRPGAHALRGAAPPRSRRRRSRA